VTVRRMFQVQKSPWHSPEQPAQFIYLALITAGYYHIARLTGPSYLDGWRGRRGQGKEARADD
jgi:hypothetical protein